MIYISVPEATVETERDTNSFVSLRVMPLATHPAVEGAPNEPSNSGDLMRRHGALSRAVSFIERNVGERLTLREVSAVAGISRFHFARLFRLNLGCSAMSYQMRLRIERSKQMLVRGDASICEIAASLGFCDQSHFHRTFRRMAGLAPGDYARLNSAAARFHQNKPTIEEARS